MNLSFFQESASSFMRDTPLNRVEELHIDAIFSTPLLSTVSASDPLFLDLKKEEIVGQHHLTPEEWMPEAKTVLSYFLPFSPVIREANRGSGLPAKEWLYGRIEGERVSEALREHLFNEARRKGVMALIPTFDSRFTVIDRKSNYSERHVAFIAGLGTFSLSRSLITSKGCAGRYGSLLLGVEMEKRPRSYKEYDEYCNQCGECIARCPAGAIQKTGKDSEICANYLAKEIRPRFKPRYGCGKCQTGVPCEDRIPR